MTEIFVGCAGWNLRKEWAADFPGAGTHLNRYAQRFNAVELNSSFYRSHRHTSYVKWADSTPANFRFAVKTPKQITHLKRLSDVEPLVEAFVAEITGLGEKLGIVLVQLPPSLAFAQPVVEPFFQDLRIRLTAPIACEPRHPSWFEPSADELLEHLGISRVAADPPIVPAAAEPGGDRRTAYFRWHGSPRMYYSSYDDDALRTLAGRMLQAATQADQMWSIFDNTAAGEATTNAMRLAELLKDA